MNDTLKLARRDLRYFQRKIGAFRKAGLAPSLLENLEEKVTRLKELVRSFSNLEKLRQRIMKEDQCLINHLLGLSTASLKKESSRF